MATNPVPYPSLKLDVSTQEDSALVVVHGALVGDTVDNFKSQVRELIPNARRIAIDLSDVTYMDSSALGAIVGVYVSAKNAHCELQLINLNQQVRHLLSVTSLLTLFESCGQHNIKLP